LNITLNIYNWVDNNFILNDINRFIKSDI